MRQWLGVKEMLVTYNAEMGTTLKEKDLKGRLKTLGFTTNDGEFAPLQEPAEIARLLGYA